MRPKRVLTALLLVVLVSLAALSAHLAITRIYQVDECQNVYMARVFATGQSAEFFTTSSLFLFGPLSWLATSQLGSGEMFAAARLIFLVVFWVNLTLLAWIASGKLFSRRGLFALLCAATLAPLWDYGFEIRHDNLILAGVLLTWALVRVKPLGLVSYLVAGGLAVTMLFIAVKSIVYVVPLSMAILVFPPPAHRTSGWRLRLAWIGGAVLAFATIRLSYGTGGAWDDYLSVFRGVSNYSAKVNSSAGGPTRLWPWGALGRLLIQTPLLLALTIAAASTVLAEVARRRRSLFNWDGMLPEFLLTLGALSALFINPTAYPYNLVHWVPYAFIFASRYALRIWDGELSANTQYWPLATSALLVIHLAPFAVATERHGDHTNARQTNLMRLAERLTDPTTDRVYDGIGMVPTRLTVHRHWYLHGLSMSRFSAPGSHVRDLLATRPPVVFIPSYRTDWLPEADHEFIRQRYIPLADDFWILGTELPDGGGSFEIFHPGRYCIVDVNPMDVDYPVFGTQPCVVIEQVSQEAAHLDGMMITNQPVHLGMGNHQIETKPGSRLAVIWVGPNVDAPPKLEPGDHQLLFRNWY